MSEMQNDGVSNRSTMQPFSSLVHRDSQSSRAKQGTRHTIAMLCKVSTMDEFSADVGDLHKLSIISLVTRSKRSKVYPTHSMYTGDFDGEHWEGQGEYTYPHKVKYVGGVSDTQLHGEGYLEYPLGQRLKGTWIKDKLVQWTYTFSDGCEYSEPWLYCSYPDRRFHVSTVEGLRAPGEERRTDGAAARPIPTGCYDVGEGFYNPMLCCIISAYDPNKIIRIPNKEEETWIVKHCRKAWDAPVGYMPEMYETWTAGTQKEVEEIEEKLRMAAIQPGENSGEELDGYPSL